MNRRQFIGLGCGCAVTALAGCSEAQTLLGGPDPEVVDTSSNQSFTGAFTGEVTISVLVANEGGTGEVRVEVTTTDGSGTTLDRYEQTVEIEEGSERRVDFEVEPSRGAERFSAEASPA